MVSVEQKECRRTRNKISKCRRISILRLLNLSRKEFLSWRYYCVVCRWKWREWVQPLFWCLTCDILMPTLWYKDAHFFNLWYTDGYYVLEVPNCVTYWLIMPTQKTFDITNLQCRTWWIGNSPTFYRSICYQCNKLLDMIESLAQQYVEKIVWLCMGTCTCISVKTTNGISYNI